MQTKATALRDGFPSGLLELVDRAAKRGMPDARARAVVEQIIVRDLWRAWRTTEDQA